jgi:hypothetical protein
LALEEWRDEGPAFLASYLGIEDLSLSGPGLYGLYGLYGLSTLSLRELKAESLSLLRAEDDNLPGPWGALNRLRASRLGLSGLAVNISDTAPGQGSPDMMATEKIAGENPGPGSLRARLSFLDMLEPRFEIPAPQAQRPGQSADRAFSPAELPRYFRSDKTTAGHLSLDWASGENTLNLKLEDFSFQSFRTDRQKSLTLIDVTGEIKGLNLRDNSQPPAKKPLPVPPPYRASLTKLKGFSLSLGPQAQEGPPWPRLSFASLRLWGFEAISAWDWATNNLAPLLKGPFLEAILARKRGDDPNKEPFWKKALGRMTAYQALSSWLTLDEAVLEELKLDLGGGYSGKAEKISLTGPLTSGRLPESRHFKAENLELLWPGPGSPLRPAQGLAWLIALLDIPGLSFSFETRAVYDQARGELIWRLLSLEARDLFSLSTEFWAEGLGRGFEASLENYALSETYAFLASPSFRALDLSRLSLRFADQGLASRLFRGLSGKGERQPEDIEGTKEKLAMAAGLGILLRLDRAIDNAPELSELAKSFIREAENGRLSLSAEPSGKSPIPIWKLIFSHRPGLEGSPSGPSGLAESLNPGQPSQEALDSLELLLMINGQAPLKISFRTEPIAFGEPGLGFLGLEFKDGLKDLGE